MSQRRKNKPAAREGCYEIRFETSAVLAANPEPSDFVREISGAINFCPMPEGAEERAGVMSARFIEVGRALNEKESIFEVFDSVDSELAAYFQALFDHDTQDYKEEFQENIGGRSSVWVRSLGLSTYSGPGLDSWH